LNNEFILHYQPQVSLQTGELAGVEALIRWEHPDRGLISPAEFLPVAEESGLIVQMGEQVLYQACHQAAQWYRAGRLVKVAVNIAERQFKHVNLPELIDKVLIKTGLPPEFLDLELTEGILIDNADEALRVLKTIKKMGVMLSLDDFGTGYSSLSYLKKFSLDTLKIDRSFIMDLPDDSDDKAITQAVVDLGRALGLEVIAEGVENDAQLNFLKEIGCQVMQGYYFSRPVPASEIEAMFESGKIFNLPSGVLKTNKVSL
jgi:EAL domain-containing protein (putative c-di-GMP-specific phosphodiesterase class I)